MPTNKKKKDKVKKAPREIMERTKEERRQEVIPIIEKLSELQLSTEYDAIKELYKLFKEYIEEGNRIEVNIPFPLIKRRIKGILAISVREPVWVKLENNP